MRIVVLGYIVRGPFGGSCSHYLQYMMGLRLMGHEVLFLEDSDNYPSCYDPDTNEMTTDPSYGVRFTAELMSRHGFTNSWAYYDAHADQWYGRSGKAVLEFCKGADVVLNISNVNGPRDWWLRIPVRILVDTDPAFTQIRHLDDDYYGNIARQHTHFFSFGENFGQPGCSIPDDGFNWQPTRQPVAFELWEIARPKPEGKWSTVMSWDAYRVRKHGDIVYGMKSASFADYFQLPAMTKERLELAVGANPPRERLREAGWSLEVASDVARTPDSFQHYIRQSKGEWSIAKHGYVVCRSGWFSERSCSYLAMGRPVIVQNTGFDRFIDTGRGLFAFNTPAEAVAQMEEVSGNHSRHSRYARELAHEFFDSRAVLTDMLARV